MQPREPELDFNQVKKDLNLVDLVLTLGYQHNRTKNASDSEKDKFYTFDFRGKPSLDQVIIYKNQQGEYQYFNRADDRDKGSVIDFIKHRIENPRIPGIEASGKNIWASVLANAKRYLNLPATERSTSLQLQQRMEPVGRGDTDIPPFLRKVLPLTDTAYLNSRGLSNETLNSPLFAGRIFNHVHEGTGKGGQPHRFINTAFPQLYQDRIVGLEIKAHGFKGQAADSLNSSALWVSNPNSKTTTLVLTDSAIDALSHYQFKQPINSLYASTSGQLTDNQVAEVRRLIADTAIKTVKLAFNNNVEGHVFDTRLIAGLARPSTPMRLERLQSSLLTLAIYSVQDEPIVKLHREVKAYNSQLTENYRKVAGQSVLAAPPTLDAEFIKAAKVAEHSYQFHVPKRLETLAFFNQALLNAFPMVARLELDKSKANDWNNQLRQELKTREHTPAQTQEVAPRRRAGPRM